MKLFNYTATFSTFVGLLWFRINSKRQVLFVKWGPISTIVSLSLGLYGIWFLATSDRVSGFSWPFKGGWQKTMAIYLNIFDFYSICISLFFGPIVNCNSVRNLFIALNRADKRLRLMKSWRCEKKTSTRIRLTFGPITFLVIFLSFFIVKLIYAPLYAGCLKWTNEFNSWNVCFLALCFVNVYSTFECFGYDHQNVYGRKHEPKTSVIILNQS